MGSYLSPRHTSISSNSICKFYPGSISSNDPVTELKQVELQKTAIWPHHKYLYIYMYKYIYVMYTYIYIMITSCASVVLKKHLTFHKSPSFSIAFLGDPARLHPMSGQKLFQGNHHLGNSRIFRRMWVDDSGNHEILLMEEILHQLM